MRKKIGIGKPLRRLMGAGNHIMIHLVSLRLTMKIWSPNPAQMKANATIEYQRSKETIKSRGVEAKEKGGESN